MSAATRAAHYWLSHEKAPEGATARVVDVRSGVAAARRTGITHHVADSAEVTVDDETTLAVRWLCGGSSIDAFQVDASEGIDCVGCRLAAATPQRPCVYYCWGEGDELLYIGSTTNAAVRIRGHANGTKWWGDVRRLTFDEHETEVAARRAEAAAIRETPGTHNREGRRPVAREDDPLLRLLEGGESA